MTEKEAVQELRENLARALDKKMGKDHLGLTDREGLANACISMAWFLVRVDGLATYSHQFNELASVLADLKYGTVHPILIPTIRSNRKRTELWCTRARVALGVWLLMESGMAVDDAIQRVATNYPKLDALQTRGPKRGSSLLASIRDWSKLFSTKEGEKVGNDEAREMYRDVRVDLTERFEHEHYTREQIEKVAIRHLVATERMCDKQTG